MRSPSGSGAALGAAAFLAVYREGFETVLFYQALFGGAPAGDVMVLAGFGAGLLVLGAVYAGFARLGLAIPIRQFFLVTGGLLYGMAVVFAGKGVHELQEVGWIGVTPVAGMPTIDVLGLHPTAETLVVQGLFVAALLYAMYRTLRRRGEPSDTPASPPAPRADVTPLRARDGRG